MVWERDNPQPKFDKGETDQLGSQLSLEIGCPIRYPAYDKHIFECKCGVIFPLYLVRGGNWELIKQKHVEERKLIV